MPETFELTGPQSIFWLASDWTRPQFPRYCDLEGAVRAGKTTAPIIRILEVCVRYPGIHAFVGRWTQDATDAQMKPAVRALGTRVLGAWDAREQYWSIPVDGKVSRLYARGLRPSEDQGRYARFAGLTLAVALIDQAEELPEDIWQAFKARISQPGYPQQLWITPNPPSEDHWLNEEFPTDNSKPDHLYIHTSLYDNRAVVGDAYIAAMEAAYPPGSALRRRFVDGRRGLTATGTPVYKGYFDRKLHEREGLEANPELPLYESHDFGHNHPATTWFQWPPWGAMHIVGGMMGESMFLEDYGQLVLQVRKRWFPDCRDIRVTGDPAGTAKSSHGVNRNASDVLKALGIVTDARPLMVVQGANSPEKRNTAIQATAGYMRRLTSHGPAFLINPRFLVVGGAVGRGRYERQTPVLTDGFEAGYVWDDRLVSGTIRRPKKDGYFDHGQNTVEYAVLQFAPPVIEKPPKKEKPKRERVLREGSSVNLGWMS